MNSLKTTIVCVVLLGVLYGMYQVINTPSPSLDEDDTPIVEDLGTPVNPEDLPLLQNDPGFAMEQDQFDSELNPADQIGGSTGAPGLMASHQNAQAPSLGPANGYADNGSLSNPNVNSRLQTPTGDGGYQRTSPGTIDGNSSGIDPNTGLRLPGSGNLADSHRDDPQLSGSGGEQAATRKLSETWSTAETLISKSRFHEALALLSSFYDDPMLTSEEQANLQSWLDALAAKVIYSMEHHIELPHQVLEYETIEQIAQRFDIPPTLLFNINQERIMATGWTPGIELKVVQGPFRAEVNLRTQRLTLWLDTMYAGSFPVRVGRDQQLEEGIYQVAAKSDQGRIYTPTNGTPIDRMSAGNPYGMHLLDLGRGVLIHGCPSGLDLHSGQGCISLEESHAQDVYEILGRNSEVRIIR